MKDSFLFLADGFEEMEALCAIDILRRAGIPLKTVSITSSLQVKGAHGVTVNADLIFDNTLFKDVNWLILPGGMPGATNLHEFAPLQGLLESHNAKGGKIAAICAAPAVVLAPLGICDDKKATSYPGFENSLGENVYMDSVVVVDQNLVTGNGPGNAMAWALSIVAVELGQEKSHMVASDLLLYPRDNSGVDYFFG
ncbi:MAG: DJ-1/PfpI family protein [Prevotella sp.]|nr:DJ-1/PfpI family protein [Bacteroides sp.]MCM1366681.1 DJ-1/PfpI family protein [Prevotella sp.]